MTTTLLSPLIVCGGMGYRVSNQLAGIISKLGQRGTVSGVSLERLMARLLQQGDPGGHLSRAFSHFPFPQVAKRVWDTYYVESGILEGARFKDAPMFTVDPSPQLIELTICANFCFVWLAKEGHNNQVAINYLEKIQMPHLYAIFGAMLAGVDIITMGAGIPLQVPKLMDDLVAGRTATYSVEVFGTNIKSYTMSFNPQDFFAEEKIPQLQKPAFVPIIASNLLASIFMSSIAKGKLPKESVQGFVVEHWTAGGHNAPPRRGLEYGEKDCVDFHKLAEFGLPFWIGGSYASPQGLKRAL